VAPHRTAGAPGPVRSGGCDVSCRAGTAHNVGVVIIRPFFGGRLVTRSDATTAAEAAAGLNCIRRTGRTSTAGGKSKQRQTRKQDPPPPRADQKEGRGVAPSFIASPLPGSALFTSRRPRGAGLPCRTEGLEAAAAEKPLRSLANGRCSILGANPQDPLSLLWVHARTCARTPWVLLDPRRRGVERKAGAGPAQSRTGRPDRRDATEDGPLRTCGRTARRWERARSRAGAGPGVGGSVGPRGPPLPETVVHDVRLREIPTRDGPAVVVPSSGAGLAPRTYANLLLHSLALLHDHGTGRKPCEAPPLRRPPTRIGTHRPILPELAPCCRSSGGGRENRSDRRRCRIEWRTRLAQSNTQGSRTFFT
jgi:hypothetical protein